MPSGFLQLDAVIHQSRRLKKGRYLFHASELFTFLFAICAGSFRAIVANQDGRDQATSFFTSGELVGVDGICSHIYSCDAVALEDSEVYELPFTYIGELGWDIPSPHSHFFRLMNREIVRDQGVMLPLGNVHTEERLAVFLLNLSQRPYSQGLTINDLILRMLREEIGSHSGLEPETVSRTLSKFRHEGLTSVEHKHIRILGTVILKRMISGCSHAI